MTETKSDLWTPDKARNGNDGEEVGAGGVGVASFFSADVRNADFTYAAGDVIAFLAARPTVPPVGFEVLDGNFWNCLGWLDTSGYIFNLTHTTKEIGAAGTLSAIRTVITGGSKTIQFTALEAMNPHVRALFDDVPVSSLLPSTGRTDAACAWVAGSNVITDASAIAADVGKVITGVGIPVGTQILSVTPTTAGAYTYTGYVVNSTMPLVGVAVSCVVGGNISAYVLPEVPQDLRYTMVFDTYDGTKQMRIYAPNCKVTTRANDQAQMADTEMMGMTLTAYPDTFTFQGQTVRATMARYMNYGPDPVASYFVAPW